MSYFTFVNYKIAEYEFNGILEILSLKSGYLQSLASAGEDNIQLQNDLIKTETQYSVFLNFWQYLNCTISLQFIKTLNFETLNYIEYLISYFNVTINKEETEFLINTKIQFSEEKDNIILPNNISLFSEKYYKFVEQYPIIFLSDTINEITKAIHVDISDIDSKYINDIIKHYNNEDSKNNPLIPKHYRVLRTKFRNSLDKQIVINNVAINKITLNSKIIYIDQETNDVRTILKDTSYHYKLESYNTGFTYKDLVYILIKDKFTLNKNIIHVNRVISNYCSLIINVSYNIIPKYSQINQD